MNLVVDQWIVGRKSHISTYPNLNLLKGDISPQAERGKSLNIKRVRRKRRNGQAAAVRQVAATVMKRS